LVRVLGLVRVGVFKTIILSRFWQFIYEPSSKNRFHGGSK